MYTGALNQTLLCRVHRVHIRAITLPYFFDGKYFFALGESLNEDSMYSFRGSQFTE